MLALPREIGPARRYRCERPLRRDHTRGPVVVGLGMGVRRGNRRRTRRRGGCTGRAISRRAPPVASSARPRTARPPRSPGRGSGVAQRDLHERPPLPSVPHLWEVVPRRGARAVGRLSAAPDLVARPGNEQELVDLLDWCSRIRELAAVPFGGGSSVVGGVEGGATRDRFEGVVSIDLTGLTGVVESTRSAAPLGSVPAPTVLTLEDELRPEGLTLRHFPQSFEHSTLGGWIATALGRPLRHQLHPHRRLRGVAAGGDPHRDRRDCAASRPPARGPRRTGCSSAPRESSEWSPRRGSASSIAPAIARHRSGPLHELRRRRPGRPRRGAGGPLPVQLPAPRPDGVGRDGGGRVGRSSWSASNRPSLAVDGLACGRARVLPRPRRGGTFGHPVGFRRGRRRHLAQCVLPGARTSVTRSPGWAGWRRRSRRR